VSLARKFLALLSSGLKKQDPSGLLVQSGALGLPLLAPIVNLMLDHGYGLINPVFLTLVLFLALVALAVSIVLRTRLRVLRPLVLGIVSCLVFEVLFLPPSLAEVSFVFGLLLMFISVSYLIGWLLSRVLCAFAATFILSTLLLSGNVAGHDSEEASTTHAVTVASQAPSILHIVLDEHIGLAGFTSDLPGAETLAARLRGDYEDAGFVVFPNAYSAYHKTEQSLGHLLNGDRGPQLLRYQDRTAGRLRATPNPWFETAAQQGRAIRVYQSDFMDYCRPERGFESVEYCTTYSSTAASTLKGRGISNVNMAVIITSYSYHGSRLLGVFAKQSNILPEWFVRTETVSPLRMPDLIESIFQDLRAHPRGRLFFAHLMIPHHLYALEADCRIADDLYRWQVPFDSSASTRSLNTAESRRTKYRVYFDQVACTHSVLMKEIAAMLLNDETRDTTIVIHGDHGSRIAIHQPRIEFALSRQDVVDMYSTLFVTNAPAAKAIESPDDPVLIQDLFAELFLGFDDRPLRAPFVYAIGPDEAIGIPLDFDGTVLRETAGGLE
jgi:hypothetical protein